MSNKAAAINALNYMRPVKVFDNKPVKIYNSATFGLGKWELVAGDFFTCGNPDPAVCRSLGRVVVNDSGSGGIDVEYICAISLLPLDNPAIRWVKAENVNYCVSTLSSDALEFFYKGDFSDPVAALKRQHRGFLNDAFKKEQP